LRLDQRVSSIEGTNFTGETNIEGGEESFEPLPGESQNFPIENEEIINSLRDLPDLHEGNAQNLPSENDGIDRGILTAQESSIIQDISGVESTITDSSTDTSSYVSPSWLVKSPLISSSGAIEEDRHLPVELSDEDGEGIDETDKFIIDHNDKRDSGKEEDCWSLILSNTVFKAQINGKDGKFHTCHWNFIMLNLVNVTVLQPPS